MRNISFIRITVVFILFSEIIIGQITRRVLFLGNSYTSVNNLPQLISDVALSAGDTLMFDSNTPGGYQLLDHNIDSVTISKIMAKPGTGTITQSVFKRRKRSGKFN